MDNIKKLRLEKGYNMKQVAKALNLPYTTYVSYERGDREPNSEVLIKIADFYNTTVDYVLSVTSVRDPATDINIKNIIPLPKTKLVPLIGTIACGTPILAEENIEDYLKVDAAIPADFALRCKGDSMINSRIYDGDIVYIRKQPDVENGEIAAVLIKDEVTLKKVYKYPNKVVLRASNPIYDDMIYTNEETENIYIIGKAVAFFSLVR